MLLREHSNQMARELTAYEQAESVLQTRRRRAAQNALGDATESPWAKGAGQRAAVAAALLALPLEYFDIDLDYFEGRWWVDGEPVAGLYASQRDDEKRLQEQYGITRRELKAITARTASQDAA